MSITPIISVIVPVYKVEPYLCQCIDSIITQTYINLEIILVEDGSPDNCAKICDEYAKKDGRVRVIHKPNGGLSDARNAGIDIATGEYLTFIDSDDWIESDMIELLYNNLINNDADISCCNYFLAYTNSNKCLNDSNEILTFNREQAIQQVMLHKYVFCNAWGKLYKKNIFNKLRFQVNKHYEDVFIILDILEKSNKCVAYPIPKYYYRQRKGSIVHNSYNSKTMDAIEAAHKNLKTIEVHYPNIIDIGNAGLFKANLNVLARLIFIKNYTKLREYKSILSIIRKNYKFIIKSDAFTKNDKIKINAIKINVKLYKLLQSINNWTKNKILFE